MAPEAAELIKAGLALDPDERAVVANRLLASLHDDRGGEDQVAVDAAWRDEITRRLDEVLDGSVTPVDADEHYAQLRGRIAAGTE
ncbi:addiction module protein [Microlunatus sp. Gsoil 973]|uniref:addiction module protein n=1 Tax=Microlunatus sp. Gsoil 973 TaxID=2672569 RepID=UPI0012B47A0A|nr:addiction module protein [Microlunatus sp. Gsoil 973]QGN33944.1 addiction module protein [Microlunatus sp. Gsoil 973]